LDELAVDFAALSVKRIICRIKGSEFIDNAMLSDDAAGLDPKPLGCSAPTRFLNHDSTLLLTADRFARHARRGDSGRSESPSIWLVLNAGEFSVFRTFDFASPGHSICLLRYFFTNAAAGVHGE
jgi:hypothetical protein